MSTISRRGVRARVRGRGASCWMWKLWCGWSRSLRRGLWAKRKAVLIEDSVTRDYNAVRCAVPKTPCFRAWLVSYEYHLFCAGVEFCTAFGGGRDVCEATKCAHVGDIGDMAIVP